MALDYKTFDVSSLALKDPKELKFIQIFDVATQSGYDLTFVTPKLRLGLGIFAIDFDNSSSRKGQRTTELANATKVTLPLSVDTIPHDENQPEWLAFMERLDKQFKKLLTENAKTWFGKEASFIMFNIDNLYNSPIKVHEKYPSMFAPKIQLDNDKKLRTSFFDHDGAPWANPVEDIPQNCLARVRYQITGITKVVSSSKFYVNIKALEVKTYPQATGGYDAFDKVPAVCSIDD